MKKLFLLLAMVGMLTVACTQGSGDEGNNGNQGNNNNGKPANNEIWYTSSDGNIITPCAVDVFGANIMSNTYNNGKGVILFDAPVTLIGESAFEGCDRLASITIPNGVTLIGEDAFEGCRSLVSITIPNSVITIDEAPFVGCESLVGFCGKYASEDNRCLVVEGVLNSFAPSGLTSYNIPNSVTSIGTGAFYRCSSLTSVTIPDSVTSIGDSAFEGCSGLANLTIPNSVVTIGYWTFARCVGLVSVIIPNSVVVIDGKAFYDCSSLENVEIGSSVTSIGNYAFGECRSLSSVYCKPAIPPTGSEGMFYDVKIYVPRNSVDAYKSAEYWSSYADDIVGYDF